MVVVRAYVQFGPEPPTPCAPGGGILPGAAFVPLRRPASSGRTRRRARRRFVGLRYGSCQVNRCVPNLRSLRRTACRGLLCLPAAAAHYLACGISRTVRRSVCLKYERLIMKEIWIRLKFARRCTPCPGRLWCAAANLSYCLPRCLRPAWRYWF